MRDMFTRSLHDIYLDIYALNKLGFSAEYIERITAFERNIFKKYKEIEDAERKNRENEDTLEEMGIDPSMLL